MNKTITSLAIASILSTSAVHAGPDGNKHSAVDDDRNLAIGIGAASGAILAGPLGLVAGGLVGSFLTEPEDMREIEIVESDTAVEETEITDSSPAPGKSEDAAWPVLALAQATDEPAAVIEAPGNRIRQIVIDNLRLPIHFRTGSTDVERFYDRQLDSIAGLLLEFPEVTLYLEGYSDRQGDAETNLALSMDRLEKVRELLTDRGIADERIVTLAHGEKKFVSTPGDLDAYVFDRRVEISMMRTAPEKGSSIAAISSD